MYYGDIELEYRQLLKRYKTKEEKLNYLRDCEFNIQMVDKWTDEDKKCYEVVCKLIKEVEESDAI